MINSKILVSVAIVLIIGVAAAGYQISQTPDLWQMTGTDNQNPALQDEGIGISSGQGEGIFGESTSGGSLQSSGQGSTGGSPMITSSQARNIAQNNYILQEGAVAGTPRQTTYGGRQAYMVPVMMSGAQVGEIYIDAYTGKSLGGAGGAP